MSNVHMTTATDGHTPVLIAQIWVCAACGKTSRTRYAIPGQNDPGWDEICALNATLCYTASIERDDNGRVRKAIAVNT